MNDAKQLLNGLGAILTYEIGAGMSAHGQQVGADGSGIFSVLFYGDPDEACQAAYDYISALETPRRRISHAVVVVNEDGYYGPNVTAVVVGG